MTNKRGGPNRGQGRPPVKQGEETVTVSLRMTETQRAKLKRLGGAGFVRDRIDRAKEPNVEFSGEGKRSLTDSAGTQGYASGDKNE